MSSSINVNDNIAYFVNPIKAVRHSYPDQAIFKKMVEAINSARAWDSDAQEGYGGSWLLLPLCMGL